MEILLGIALLVTIVYMVFIKTKFTKLSGLFDKFKQDTKEELTSHYEFIGRDIKDVYKALSTHLDIDLTLRYLKEDIRQQRIRITNHLKYLPAFNQEAVRFYLNPTCPGIIPTRANPNDSGWDMYCNLELLNLMVKTGVYELPKGVTIATGQEGLFITIGPGVKLKIPTGVHYLLPYAIEASVRPKSGISLKTELELTNAPGTIDNGYTGDASIIVKNCGRSNIVIKDKQSIAQVVFQYVIPIRVSVQPVNNDTFELAQIIKDRGAKGFGSSGIDGDITKMGEADTRIHIQFDPRFDICEMISVMGEELIKDTLRANPDSVFVYNNVSISGKLLLQHLISPVERRGVLPTTITTVGGVLETIQVDETDEKLCGDGVTTGSIQGVFNGGAKTMTSKIIGNPLDVAKSLADKVKK